MTLGNILPYFLLSSVVLFLLLPPFFFSPLHLVFLLFVSCSSSLISSSPSSSSSNSTASPSLPVSRAVLEPRHPRPSSDSSSLIFIASLHLPRPPPAILALAMQMRRITLPAKRFHRSRAGICERLRPHAGQSDYRVRRLAPLSSFPPFRSRIFLASPN